ncbi:MAG TPA: beta-phosphoglucomutase family hydrolase [Bacillota bacterium]|nr:beta-phosphoglucomutase family hydrolase [Bacillota bacterium]
MISIEPQVKGLIFDVDGTLVDTMPTHFKTWQELAKTYGFSFPEELFLKYAGMSTNKIINLINHEQGFQLDPEELTKIKNQAYLKLVSRLELIKPVFAIVTRYHGKLPMALGTGEFREVAMVNIKAAGLDRYFDLIVTADDVTHSKPDPETFLKCARLMNVPPEACQVFEDGDPGLQAARRAGMIATDIRPYLECRSS